MKNLWKFKDCNNHTWATRRVYEEYLLLAFVEQSRSQEALETKTMAHKKRDDTWFE